MQIGQRLLTRHEGNIIIVTVCEMFYEDLIVDFQGEKIKKLYSEVRIITRELEEKYDKKL